MKVLVLSDLHLELGTTLALPPGLEYDTVVLAGDIHSPGHKAVHWARRDSVFGGKPVVFVPGNHEFYGCAMDVELLEMLRVSAGSNVHLLHRGDVVIGGVRFIGCTLWTDFQLGVRQSDGTTASNIGQSLLEASRCMNDFRLIEVQAPAVRQQRGRMFRRLLRPEDTLAMHWIDRDWLRRALEEPFDGPTVVVTHHAPSRGSVAERYVADWLTPAFVSDLPDAFFEVPVLWIHGHTHTAFDYQRGACRVVSNPRGYRQRDGSFENRKFEAGLVVEVEAHRTPRALDEFYASARGSVDEYLRTGVFRSAEEVVAKLEEKLKARRRQLSQKLGIVANEKEANPSLVNPEWEPTDGQLANIAARAWDLAAATQACVLFLDFDGVLHPFGCSVDKLFCRLDLLQDWLRRRPTVRVVISSSWREHHPLEEMRSYFADDLQDRVIDVTPRVTADPWRQRDETIQPRHGRHIEVVRWLSDNGLQRFRWAALDDQATEFPAGCQQLVLCDSAVGLTPAELHQVDVVLGLTVGDAYVSEAHTSSLLASGAPARAARLAAADMVDAETAAAIAGVELEQLLLMVSVGRCIGLEGTAGLRLPRWQFVEPLWPALPRIARGLGASGWELLSFLEAPHGALGGITPRQAVERGQVERVVNLAGRD